LLLDQRSNHRFGVIFMQLLSFTKGLSFHNPQPLNRKFSQYVSLSGLERTFSRDDVIVTKTDLKGRITYANKVFCDIAGITELEALGAPHSFLRHPDMPRCVFKLLWDRISSGHEVFAYVINMASTGDHYWVFAHITPTFDKNGVITGYHSNRRVPEKQTVANIVPLYKTLKSIEDSATDRNKGMRGAMEKLGEILNEKGVGYDEFIFSL
jgi:PAS domain S-box-containing protein